MVTEDELAGVNIEEPVIAVDHATLECADDSSWWRRVCPKCKLGTLLVRRDAKTYVLSAEDRCVLCGQSFVYNDIEGMRKKDGKEGA